MHELTLEAVRVAEVNTRKWFSLITTLQRWGDSVQLVIIWVWVVKAGNNTRWLPDF